jgi:hypothetical protein
MEVKTGLKRGDQILTQKCQKNLKFNNSPEAKSQKWIYSHENKVIISENNKRCLDLYNSESDHIGAHECDGRESQIWEYDTEEHTFKSNGKCLSIPPKIEQTEVWAGNLSDGYYVVLLFNKASYENTVEVTWEEVGLKSNRVTVRDLWAKKDLGVIENKYSVKLQKHESQLLKVIEYKETTDDNNNNLFYYLIIIIPAFLVLVVIVILIICCIKKKKTKRDKNSNNNIDNDNLNAILDYSLDSKDSD